MFDKLKKAAGHAKDIAEKAKTAAIYVGGSPADRDRIRRKAKQKKLIESNDQWMLITCRACGIEHRVNSVYGGRTLTCNCGAQYDTPNYVDYVEDQKSQEPQEQPASQKPKPKMEFHDLESAILYFNQKKEKILQLPIDEDEKEMLLMKLQEKRERVLDELI